MKNNIKNIFLLFFPAFVVFFIIPMSIFVPNQEGFYNEALSILTKYFGMLGCWLFIASLVVILTKGKDFKVYYIIFFLGFYFVLKDLLFPLKLDGMLGLDFSLKFDAPLHAQIADSFLLIATVAASFVIPKRLFNSLLIPIAIFFSVLQCGAILINMNWFAVSADHRYKPASFDHLTAIHSNIEASQGNVYLICLDGFTGRLFLQALEEENMKDTFDNFFYFINNKTNYTFTWPSMASIFSASFYDKNKGDMAEWIIDNRIKGGLIQEFKTSGYAVWQYGEWRHQAVSDLHYRAYPYKRTLLSQAHSSLDSIFNSMLLLRLSPLVVRKMLNINYITAQEKFNLFLSDLIVNSLELLRLLKHDEIKRPKNDQLVFLHTYLPHPPYFLDRECNETYSGLKASSNRDMRLEQSICALKAIGDWITALKRQNKFMNSTIIIFSDHGYPYSTHYNMKESRVKMENKVRMEVNKQSWHSVSDLYEWSDALLLIKPPQKEGQHVPLKISTLQTQNGDIGATLNSLIGIPKKFNVGISVFSPSFPLDRKIDIWDGFERIYSISKKKRFSFSKIKGAMRHFKFSHQSGWELLPNYDIVYNSSLIHPKQLGKRSEL